MNSLLPRASLRDLLRGRAAFVGSRLSESSVRGWFSPVEARVHLGLDYDDLQAEETRLLAATTSGARVGMVCRGLLSSLLAGSGSESKAVSLFGIAPANLSVSQAVDYVFETSNPQARIIYFAHPHALNVSLLDEELWRCLRDADAVFADGIGVRLGTRLLGGRLHSNLNGTDMYPLLCRRAAESGRPLVLIGARRDVVEECARRTRAAHEGLSIPIVSDGYLDEAASRKLAAAIRELDNPIVLVGMGSPIQEKWVKRYLSELPGCTTLSVGGLFDFYSGRIPRAPAAWRELGLEWLYRLVQEPKRMARRYLLGNPLFLAMIAAQRLGINPRTLAALPGPALLLGVKRQRTTSNERANHRQLAAMKKESTDDDK